ncbi:MAG: hypothetical protein KDK70_00340 [Myxococcales bacterium]|nr:hypothetical protein [Myxococcales bacterium]
MKRCVSCQRHLRVPEPRCPFCGARQGALPRGPSVRLVLVLGLASASCTDPEPPGGDDSGSSTQATTSTTAPDPTATSTSGTSVDTTVGPTSGSTSMESSGTTVITDSEGNSFVLYGGGDVGEIIECDLYSQDCGQGSKCMPWANDGGPVHNATRCAPVDPDPVSTGEVCTVEGSGFSGIDDCALGQMCLGVDEVTLEGRCVELCGGSEAAPTCDTPGSACTLVFQLPLPLCLVPCDPLDPMCPEGHACTELDDGSSCLPG